jgi:uncharacterized protein YecE (DUF72 family)
MAIVGGVDMKTDITVRLVAAVAVTIAGCQRSEVAEDSIEARTVLRRCGITDVTEPRLLAWAAENSEQAYAAIVGQRGSKHVLIVAVRAGNDANPNRDSWSVAETSLMLGDGKKSWDVWVRADKEYDYDPGASDLQQLCRDLQWEEDRVQWQFMSPQ